MADAVQRLFPGTKVAFGPTTDDGFYYDYDRPDGTFSEEDLRAIEEKMAEIVEADSPFRREVVTRDEATQPLAERIDESFKLEHLERLEDPDLALPTRRMGGPLRRAARSFHRLLESGEADQRGRCLLAGRRAQSDAPAHLWHGVFVAEGACALI